MPAPRKVLFVAALAAVAATGAGVWSWKRPREAAAPAPSAEDVVAVPADHPFAKTKISGAVLEQDTNQPVPNATLLVAPKLREPRLGPPEGDGSVLFHARADGTFDLLGIPAGDFTVTVRADGWRRRRIPLTKGEVVEDDQGINFLLVRSRSVSGTVLDLNGAPVAGAKLFSVEEGVGCSTPTGRYQTASASDGSFRFDSLLRGAMGIGASHPAHGTAFVAVPPGNDRVDGVAVRFEPGRTLRGVIRGPDGPIAGASIRVIRQSAGGHPLSDRLPRREGVTAEAGADGAFDFKIAARGPATLRIAAPGFVRKIIALPETAGGDGAPLEVVLERGIDAGGIAKLPGGGPAHPARIRVMARLPDGSMLRRTAWTDAAGKFRLDGIPAKGPYLVMIAHHAYPLFQKKEEQLGAAQEYALPAPGGIRGRVIDDQKESPITHFKLFVRGPSRPGMRVVSSPGGAIELERLAAGPYLLRVNAEGYDLAMSDKIVVEPGKIAEVVLRLKRAGAEPQAKEPEKSAATK